MRSVPTAPVSVRNDGPPLSSADAAGSPLSPRSPGGAARAERQVAHVPPTALRGRQEWTKAEPYTNLITTNIFQVHS